jgi:hypothetical protein
MSATHPTVRRLLLPPILTLLSGAGPLAIEGQVAPRSDGLFAVGTDPLLVALAAGPPEATALPFATPELALTPVLRVANRRDRGIRFMIGGGVAVVAGSLIGGDGGTLILVGGLLSLGYGFYLYHEP